MMDPVFVRSVLSGEDSRTTTLAMPKSTIFTTLSPFSRRERHRLALLMSRWMMPASCAAWSPTHAWAATLSARSGESGPTRCTSCFRSSPESSSMTM
jgi:hypothetical protein